MDNISSIENWLERHSIFNYTISNDLKVNVDESVNLSGALEEDTIPVNFEYVNGYFDISKNNLTSLEGCPKIVARNFDCSSNQLSSLKGCPQKVGDFNCSNNKLRNLLNLPKEIFGSFNCSNNKITSLEYCPKVIKGYFDCSSNELISLEYAPKVINGYFDCSINALSNLADGPKNVQKDYICFSNNFHEFKEIADEIGGDVVTDLILDDLSRTYNNTNNTYKYEGKDVISKVSIASVELTNRKDISEWLTTYEIRDFTILPDGSVDVNGSVKLAEKLHNLSKIPIKFNEIKGNFDISDNQLISLQGCPNIVKGDFLAFKNRLASLKGAPKKVSGNFIVLKNNLMSLKDAPSMVEEDFICSYNPLKSFDGLNTVLGAVFSNILVSDLEYQKYIYNNIVTYKYSGVALNKFLSQNVDYGSEEDRIFQNNKKNLSNAMSRLIQNNELKKDMINDILIENLTKYGLDDLKERVLEIKNPKPKEENPELSEDEILKMAFETKL